MSDFMVWVGVLLFSLCAGVLIVIAFVGIIILYFIKLVFIVLMSPVILVMVLRGHKVKIDFEG